MIGRWLAAAMTVALTIVCAPRTSNAEDISIVLTGQALLQSDIRTTYPDAVSTVRPLMNGDVNFTNFETTVKLKGDPVTDLAPVGGLYGPPEALDVLTDMGVNLMALSNNHAFDLATLGLLNTLREVKARKIAHAGIGENITEAAAPGYLHTPKSAVALVSMASGLIREGGHATDTKPGINEIRLEDEKPGVDAGHPNPEDTKRILDSIKKARKEAGLVIAYQHNHAYDVVFVDMMSKRMPERLVPPNWIKKWAHEEVDAGADIVVLHGAPLLQGVEIYKGKPIFYDLGNFIFQVPVKYADVFEPMTLESVITRVVFDGRKLKSISFRPIILSNKGVAGTTFNPGIPTIATGAKAQEILGRLADASRPFGTVLAIKGETAEITPANR
jgi:poly-gamma-glutamate synthesis protein (capsule biosynthesis protein)